MPDFDCENFQAEVIALFGTDRVVVDQSVVKSLLKNSLGIEREVLGVIYPISTEEVVSLVSLANKYKAPLYPISRGKNIGYGEMVPAKNGCHIVSLERMNKIRDFEPISGKVVIEPGVTQAELASFLLDNNTGHVPDVTGGPTDSSVVGNILEGGFGHTRLGDRRKHINDIEVVLGNGELLKCGDSPSLGPEIYSLFVQSNFGIVTAMRIPVMRRPKHIETFTVSFPTEESFLTSLPALSILRQQGIVQGALHIGNATRTFVSLNTFPEDVSTEHILTEAECQARMKNPFVNVGAWTAISSVTGSLATVEEYKKLIAEALPKEVELRFFTNGKIQWLKKFVRYGLAAFPKYQTALLKNLASIEDLGGLMQGIPSDNPTKNILWRSKNADEAGLIWYGPVMKANRNEVSRLLEIARRVFKEERYEMPVTFTMIDREHIIGVFNISFNKLDEKEVFRAHGAYRKLAGELHAAGIFLYRATVLGNIKDYLAEDRTSALKGIKSAWDPNNIISPGRYGIDLSE